MKTEIKSMTDVAKEKNRGSKRGGGEMKREQEIEKILRLLRLMDEEMLHRLYITALYML